MKLILLCIILLGCQNPDTSNSYVNPEIGPYYSKVIESCQSYKPCKLNLFVNFGATKKDEPAYYLDNKLIVNRDLWDEYSDVQREIVLLHEVGHALGRDHSVIFLNGLPLSIMEANILNEDLYMKHRESYLRELFTADNGGLIQELTSKPE